MQLNNNSITYDQFKIICIWLFLTSHLLLLALSSLSESLGPHEALCETGLKCILLLFWKVSLSQHLIQ